MRALMMRSILAGHWKLMMTYWEPSSKLNLLKLHKRLPKNSTSTITVVQHLKQTGKVKKLDKWVTHDLTTNQKSCHFEVSSSLTVHDNEQFFYQIVMHNEKVDYLWYQMMTSSMVRPRRSSTAVPKAKLAPKKVMVTVWWSAAHLIHYSFLNLCKTITSEKYAQQTDEMHWKL